MPMFHHHQWIPIAATALTLGVPAPAHRHVSASPATSLIGTWRLVRRTQRLLDGTTREHPVAVGYLIYTDVHRMCYVAMDPERAPWVSPVRPTPDEAVRTVDGLQAYCSRVEVNEAAGYVLHHIEIEKAPNLVGHDRKRWFTFVTSDELHLRIDRSEVQPPVVDDELVWARVSE